MSAGIEVGKSEDDVFLAKLIDSPRMVVLKVKNSAIM
jgi:hypothetical protein